MSTVPETATRFDLYQIVNDKIIAAMEQGIIPWRKLWSSAGPPMNGVSKCPYQGINLWLLLLLPYESNLYLTWNQIKKLNGSVNKGEKGHLIVYWTMHKPALGEEQQNGEVEMVARPILGIIKCSIRINVILCPCRLWIRIMNGRMIP
ncbi:MAG TPA: ArdC family protein [Flavisolibacter sp.]|nr:ArdC family protein [Flavisolibacter sp.]